MCDLKIKHSTSTLQFTHRGKLLIKLKFPLLCVWYQACLDFTLSNALDFDDFVIQLTV